MRTTLKCPIITVTTIIFIIFYFNRSVERTATKIQYVVDQKRSDKINNDKEFVNDKWIVITSVSLPTEDIKEMAELTDWQIVVVADQKTPKDWNWKNCVYLSVEKQNTLGYEILSLLLNNSYTRKMIGYLYAIKHGAKYIYDTDDDNLPIKLGLDAFEYSNETSGLIYRKSNPNDSMGKGEFFNVYAHFGRPDVWPRGYPLELINQSVGHEYNLCGKMKTPIVQQGLVDKDADVDAIYRMIFVRNKTAGLNVLFDSTAPPVVLPKNAYCPFNSQNTLFHYDAFWALLLLTTVTFRVTDIWRGYWAQRLLHLTNNHLGFFPPNARQSRNAHNYHKDFIEEQQIYIDVSRIVNFLQEWSCGSLQLSECVTELSRYMFTNKFWGFKDVQLTEAWIKDLVKIGYTFPKITYNSETSIVSECRNANYVSTMFQKSQLKPYAIDNIRKITDFCQPFIAPNVCGNKVSEEKFTHTKNVNLVVVINTDKYAQIPLLLMMYEPWFANVIFCANFNPDWTLSKLSKTFHKLWLEYDKFSFVNLTDSEIQRGEYLYMCLNIIGQMKFINVDGFLVIADDMVLNFWNFYDVHRVEFTDSCRPEDQSNGSWPSDFDGTCSSWKTDRFWPVKGLPVLKRMIETTSHQTFIFESEYTDLWNKLKIYALNYLDYICDIYYVPLKLLKQYQLLAQLFFDHRIYLDYAIPKILYLLGWANAVHIDHRRMANDYNLIGKYYCDFGGRGGTIMFDYYNKSETYLHPIKWSNMDNEEFKAKFCKVYVTSMIEAVSHG